MSNQPNIGFFGDKVEDQDSQVNQTELNIIYVGKHGNDDNDGRSIDRAKLTFTNAIDSADAPNDSIECKDNGIYTENLTLKDGLKIKAPNATLIGHHICKIRSLIEFGNYQITDGQNGFTYNEVGTDQYTYVKGGRVINGLASNVIDGIVAFIQFDFDIVELSTGSLISATSSNVMIGNVKRCIVGGSTVGGITYGAMVNLDATPIVHLTIGTIEGAYGVNLDSTLVAGNPGGTTYLNLICNNLTINNLSNINTNAIVNIITNETSGPLTELGTGFVKLVDFVNFQTNKAIGDTAIARGWDVDGGVWKNFITITAGNTPTCSIDGDVTAVTQAPGDNSTKIATTAFVTAALTATDTLAEILAIGNTTGANNIVVSNSQAINTALVDDNYFTIGAVDNDTNLITEVARAQGASDPYFSTGGSQQFKFYNSGTALFGSFVTSDGATIEIGAAGIIKSGSTNGDTLLLASDDTTFITFTTGATDTCTISGATITGNLTQTVSDGGSLGTGLLMWSDLYLASGGVIDFNNGNYKVTHSAGLLTMDGALTVTGTLTDNLTATAKVHINGSTTRTGTTECLDIDATIDTSTATDDVPVGTMTISRAAGDSGGTYGWQISLTTGNQANGELSYLYGGTYNSSASNNSTSNATVFYAGTPTTSAKCNDYGLLIEAGYDQAIYANGNSSFIVGATGVLTIGDSTTRTGTNASVSLTAYYDTSTSTDDVTAFTMSISRSGSDTGGTRGMNITLTTAKMQSGEWSYNYGGTYSTSNCTTLTSNAAVFYAGASTVDAQCNDYGIYISAGYDVAGYFDGPVTITGATTVSGDITVSGSANLGGATSPFSNLYLASGGTINFNNSDITITHSANNLAFAGSSGATLGYSFDNNVIIGATTAGTSAVGVLALSNSATAPSAGANLAQLYSADISPDNATLALWTETAVAADVGLASTHSLTVFMNGSKYKIMLVAVA